MRWVKIQLDSDGDDNRIIKHADIDLFVEIDGPRSCYKAIHRPTGAASDPNEYHASAHDGWTIEKAKNHAVAQCIFKAMMR